jgi:hypothetical protein
MVDKYEPPHTRINSFVKAYKNNDIVNWLNTNINNNIPDNDTIRIAFNHCIKNKYYESAKVIVDNNWLDNKSRYYTTFFTLLSLDELDNIPQNQFVILYNLYILDVNICDQKRSFLIKNMCGSGKYLLIGTIINIDADISILLNFLRSNYDTNIDEYDDIIRSAICDFVHFTKFKNITNYDNFRLTVDFYSEYAVNFDNKHKFMHDTLLYEKVCCNVELLKIVHTILRYDNLEFLYEHFLSACKHKNFDLASYFSEICRSFYVCRIFTDSGNYISEYYYIPNEITKRINKIEKKCSKQFFNIKMTAVIFLFIICVHITYSC